MSIDCHNKNKHDNTLLIYKSGCQKRHEQVQRDAAAIAKMRSIMTYFGKETEPWNLY